MDSTTGEALIGATVSVRGTTQGTVTDADGSFTLALASGGEEVELSVTYIGYDELRLLAGSGGPLEILLQPSPADLGEILVTARRRNEDVQTVPIPVAVLGARELDNSVTFSVNQVKEMVPSVQLYSSNPRNTTLNIRGLGSTFGLTNDGIDPGVGFYVDGVYYARAAATTLDFIDIQQIEVLRGPQGTLFGKNTTAGTFNITTRKPTFSPSVSLEQSFGNLGFVQTRGSVSGPILRDRLAARLSFTGTNREGTLYNVRTEKSTNSLNNQGVRAQLLYQPREGFDLTLIGDYTRQRPDGYAQVFAGAVPTQRAGFRQFDAIISDLNYQLPSRNPFDRLIDTDTPWRADQDMGGVSLQGNLKVGSGTLTSISAWRAWHWDPSNDRDFTGLYAVARSQAPSNHQQWSQEVRYAGTLSERLNGVVGVFVFYQQLDPDGAHILEAGRDQWRFVQHNQDPLWQTPGLLDGLTEETRPQMRNLSGALFGQVAWEVSDRFKVLPGLRLNYDRKSVNFSRTVTGGLPTTDPALLALQQRVFTPLSFATEVADYNLSGQLTLAYDPADHLRWYATYSLAFKPVGLNLGGIPVQDDRPILELAVVQPERVNHLELGLKSEPFRNATLNLTGFYTLISDYQTNVQSEQLGVTRGYLANADLVRVAGSELEWTYTAGKHLRTTLSASYLDGRYVSFHDAPVPLEETGGVESKDISGEVLPGISKWSASGGAEYYRNGKLLGQTGEWFAGTDAYFRTGFSSSPSTSAYLNVPGYALLNARIGFRMPVGFTLLAWGRNIGQTDYFEQLLPAGGNAGQYAAVLGDPATYGITLRYTFL